MIFIWLFKNKTFLKKDLTNKKYCCIMIKLFDDANRVEDILLIFYVCDFKGNLLHTIVNNEA